MRRSLRLGVACIYVLVAGIDCCDALLLGDFDWRSYGASMGDYTTPIRNQGPCGSCWAFGATAALESHFEIYYDDPFMDLDLSEQHLLCDGDSGSCSGGWEFKAMNHFVTDGITNEATLPYEAKNTSVRWPMQAPYDLYGATQVDTFIDGGSTTDGIKAALKSYGPLVTFFDTVDWYWPMGMAMAASEATVGIGKNGIDASGEVRDPGYHCVSVIGYKDVITMTEGGFWIVKNSWGPWWGDSGYGFVAYGDLERWNRTHAISGQPWRKSVGAPDGGWSISLLGWGLLSLAGVGSVHRR